MSFNGETCKLEMWDRAADRLYIMVWNDAAKGVNYLNDGTYTKISHSDIQGENCAIIVKTTKLETDLNSMY